MNKNLRFALALAACLFSATAAIAQTTFRASLDNAQANTTATAASGTGVCVLSADRSRVDFQVTVTGLTGPITVAHFHVGAPGVAGPVVRNLTFSNNTVFGAWRSNDAAQPLTSALADSLLAGRLYFNVHTAANPGGEIRGQLSRAATGSLSARQTETRATPNGFLLEQNYPNPFNPTTVIGYQVGAAGAITLKVYDLLGREIQTLVNERQSAGRYEVAFNASSLPSGLYFYRLQAGAFSETRKMRCSNKSTEPTAEMASIFK